MGVLFHFQLCVGVILNIVRVIKTHDSLFLVIRKYVHITESEKMGKCVLFNVREKSATETALETRKLFYFIFVI